MEVLVNYYPSLIEHPDGEGAKPVHYAAMNGETNMLNFLIARGANIMVTDFNDETPLHLGTIKKKRLEVYFLILFHPH